MPPPFREITIDEFADLLENFPFTRRINSVHMHHTWRPRHADYRGRPTIEGMWRYHTRTNGWSDIAQHITIAPDGAIWTGRGWNEPPASARNHNGNRNAGPFMFEMIGDFDSGRDPFRAPQLDVAIEVIARMQRKFDLPAESLRFHNQLSSKTCPGSAIDYGTIVAAVRELRGDLERQPLHARAAAADLPFPDAARGSSERGFLIDLLSGEAARTSDPPDAEPTEDMPPLDAETVRTPSYTLAEIRARAAQGRQSPWDADTRQNYRANDPWISNTGGTRGGQRRALCVGINTYPTAPLFGCVADASNWAEALEQLGFQVSTLFNEQANREAILSGLSDLVRSGAEGDVLVFQYSGHGTNVPNINSNDNEIDTRDEAICPHDFANGALIIDDDVAELFASLGEGVNLTTFMDCCHSQTNTRFGIGPTVSAPRGSDSRPRLVPPTAQLDQKYIEFRRTHRTRSFSPRRGRGLMRNASFAACLDRELAWESAGQGDFTRIAIPLLRHVWPGITNAEFARRVESDFGPNPRQHPRLDAPVSVQEQLLLQPATRASNVVGSNTNGKPTSEFSSVAQALRAFASLIESKST